MKNTRPRRLIGYIRVSTDKQGIRGLGMDVQKAAIAAYAASSGCELVATYEEVESGRKNDRPQLAMALVHAERLRGVLVIAKLDRLARNVKFIATIMDSDADFVALDLPGADRRTIHIMAAVAEGEAVDISQRTKAGLAALKARGLYSTKLGRFVTLGAPQNLTEDDRRKGAPLAAAAIKRNKAKAYRRVLPVIAEMKAQGLSLYAIAKRLNDEGEETRYNRPWNAMQVSRVLKMAAYRDAP